MRNKAGDIEAKRKCIANTFGKFSETCAQARRTKEKTRRTTKEDLKNTCDHADDDENIDDDKQDKHISESTVKEMSIAIDSLKRGKSADSKGIRAEDLEGADEETNK